MVALTGSGKKDDILCILCNKFIPSKEVNFIKICKDCKPIAENRYMKNFCESCNYNKCKKALDIHHVDRNHSNNEFYNLMVLCSNCHREEHANDGKMSFKKIYGELKDKRNVT